MYEVGEGGFITDTYGGGNLGVNSKGEMGVYFHTSTIGPGGADGEMEMLIMKAKFISLEKFRVDWNNWHGQGGSLNWSWGLDMALGAAETNAARIIHNRRVISNPWYQRPALQGPITVKYPLGTLDISRSRLNQVATGLKVTGVALGVYGVANTVIEIAQGKKDVIGEGGLDIVMGLVGFAPGGGWIVSGAYFGGKALMEWAGWDFWNE